MPARFAFLTIETPDIEATAKFYRDLGVDLYTEREYGPKHYNFLKPVPAEFYPVKPEYAGGGVMIGIDTDDLDGLLAKIDSAAIIKPVGVYAGVRRFIFRDPDGRRVYVREAKAGQT